MTKNPFMVKKLILTNKKLNLKNIFLYNSSNNQKFVKRWLFVWSNNTNIIFLKFIEKFRKNLGAIPFNKTLISLQWLSFLSIYRLIMLRSFYLFFSYIRENSKKLNKRVYIMYLNFKKTRIYVNIYKGSSVNYLSLSVGLFLKFFKNKKSLKKNKTLKVLLIKYLRKLCIITNFKSFDLNIRRVPLYLQELITLLMKPITHPFINPFTKKLIDETRNIPFKFDFRTIVFNKNKPYHLIKVRKKGRIKRKITKRVVKMNSLVD